MQNYILQIMIIIDGTAKRVVITHHNLPESEEYVV